MKRLAFGALCLGLLCGVTTGHMGMTYPPPRDTADTQMTSPCGAESGQFTATFTELVPGQTLNVILNAVTHTGHNYRIALSQVNTDTYDCILIDHIPQIPSSANAIVIPVVIPDVDCPSCALQAIMVVPSGTCCSHDANTCGGAWYACANVKIAGKTPRSELKCAEPCTWAYRDEKPSIYNSVDNGAVWIPNGNNNFTLNVTGKYYPPVCQNVTKSTCSRSSSGDGSGSGSSSDKSINQSLATGGKMSAGGVVGIVLVILVLAGIGVTWFITVKNKKNANKNPPMMASQYGQQQAIVNVDGQDTTGTYGRPQMPPPPPKS